MIAIIPCAGRGTRRAPDTNFTPKILLDYQGDPMIEHIVRPIDASDCFDRIVFVVSPKHGQRIIDYVRHNPFETPVRFVWQNEPLGFGHAVFRAREEVFSPMKSGFRLRSTFWKWNPLRSVSPRPVLIATDDGVRNPADPDKPSFDLIREMTGSSTSMLGVKWVGNVRQHGMVISGESGKVGRREDGKAGRRENGKTGRREYEKAGRREGGKVGHLPRPNSPAEEAWERGGEGTWGRGGVSRSEDPDLSGEASKAAPSEIQPVVERLIEKPYWDEGGFVMTGLYFVRESRRLFRNLNRVIRSGRCVGGEYQLTHALQLMIDAGTEFRTHYHSWVDCGKTGK